MRYKTMFKRILILFLTLILLFTAACAGNGGAPDALQPSGSLKPTASAGTPRAEITPTKNPALPVTGEYYYDLENVVLYLDLYGELPPNFITKAKARELGWSGGSVEDYIEGGAIGGDFFGNYEELLPKADGRSYHECDIDTNGASGRGAKRLVFSNDGLYFYTSDHYESFSQVYVTEDFEVVR